jgi:hypothetical protein
MKGLGEEWMGKSHNPSWKEELGDKVPIGCPWDTPLER